MYLHPLHQVLDMHLEIIIVHQLCILQGFVFGQFILQHLVLHLTHLETIGHVHLTKPNVNNKW